MTNPTPSTPTSGETPDETPKEPTTLVALTEREIEMLRSLIYFADNHLYKQDSRGAKELEELEGPLLDKLYAD